WARVFAQRPRPGRAGRDDLFYARIAATYVEACIADRRRGLVELQRRLAAQRQHFSPAQLRSLVGEARRRGLLTAPPHKGVQGGELTSRAIEELNEGTDNGAH